MTDKTLKHLPDRPQKPRKNGVCMMMDKGLSLNAAQDIVDTAGHLIDFIKLGFGTSIVSNNVKEKIEIYQKNNIKVFLGGTLFEAYAVRDEVSKYMALIEDFKCDAIEISDGSILMDHNIKCAYIKQFAKDYTVLSEIGSKDAGVVTAPAKWIQNMEKELEAGSTYVITESRESGTVGIYHSSGNPHVNLVNKIVDKIPSKKIIWEAPKKSQQTWFIEILGANVNLGNIAPEEVIPLETLRLGLRGDTFFQFLPEEYQIKKIPADQSDEIDPNS